MVTVGEDGLLDTVARPESPRQARLYENLPPAALRKLLRAEPEWYRHCTFVQETFERASAIPLDDTSSGPIQVRGRLDCGMAFTGMRCWCSSFRETGPPRGGFGAACWAC
ncbi:hypothetical protein H8958_011317 [Nasalis larvatus]